MLEHLRAYLAAALATALAASLADAVFAQSKIVCWKDKTGKVVGCGDRVPPEYLDAPTRELDRTGMTRKITGSAEEEARRAAQKAEKDKQKDEQNKRLAEERRKDMALLNTYADEREIDQRRDRELQQVDRQITQLQASHKIAIDRQSEVKARLEAAERANRPSDAIKDEFTRAESDRDKLAQNIADKEKEKEEVRARYAQTRQRYIELSGGSAQPAAAPSKK